MLAAGSVVAFQVERDTRLQMRFVQFRGLLQSLLVQLQSVVLLAFAVELLALLHERLGLGGSGLRGCAFWQAEERDQTGDQGKRQHMTGNFHARDYSADGTDAYARGRTPSFASSSPLPLAWSQLFRWRGRT